MYQAQTNSDGEVRRDSDGKENIEEAITNMLEKVLKEENSGEDCAAKNDETNFSISGEEMPSFLQEDSSRKERKANTNKPLRSKYPSNLISEQPPRFNKKFNTVNANKQRLDMKEKQIEYGMTFFPQNFEYKPIFHSKLPYPHSYYPPIEKNPVKELEDFAQNVLSDADRIDIDSYNQLKGLFYKIITTQNGSRITQRVIKKTNKDILSLILNEIKDQVHEMIVDPYANYFMQKFFSALKQTDRLLFLTHVGTHIIQISKSKIGTYPVQAFIEQLVTTEEKLIVIEAVKNYVLNLCFVRKQVINI